MVRRRLFWMIIVEKWKPPLKLPKCGSKKRGSEKAVPPNRWFSTQERSASLNSLHAPREGSI